MVNRNGLSESVEGVVEQPEFNNRSERKRKWVHQVVYPQHKRPKLEEEIRELAEDLSVREVVENLNQEVFSLETTN